MSLTYFGFIGELPEYMCGFSNKGEVQMERQLCYCQREIKKRTESLENSHLKVAKIFQKELAKSHQIYGQIILNRASLNIEIKASTFVSNYIDFYLKGNAYL